MKRIFLIPLFALVFLKLSAIDFEGILVTLEGDTIKCQVTFNESVNYSHRGEILNGSKISVLVDGEKMTYAPDELLNYSVLIAGIWKTYWGVNTSKNKYKFMKKEVEGKLTLYSSVTYNSFKHRYDTHFVFERPDVPDKLFLQLDTTNVRQKLIEFLANCPEASSLIFAKEIDLGRSSHWKLLAQKYNEEC